MKAIICFALLLVAAHCADINNVDFFKGFVYHLDNDVSKTNILDAGLTCIKVADKVIVKYLNTLQETLIKKPTQESFEAVKQRIMLENELVNYPGCLPAYNLIDQYLANYIKLVYGQRYKYKKTDVVAHLKMFLQKVNEGDHYGAGGALANTILGGVRNLILSQ